MTETSNFIWGQHVNYIPEFLLISKDLHWKGWVIQQSCPRRSGVGASQPAVVAGLETGGCHRRPHVG